MVRWFNFDVPVRTPKKNHMSHTLDTFWDDLSAARSVERRILWQFDQRFGEFTISIAPEKAIPDIAVMTDATLKPAVLDAKKLKSGSTVAPPLVFATIVKPQHGENAVVRTGNGRELTVVQIIPRAHKEKVDLSIQAQMKRAHMPMPTAAVTIGDSAVGFLIRTDVVHFYPLVAVGLPEEIESYRLGEGTGADLMGALPFQS